MRINTPDQNKAIASFMRKRKAAWAADGRTARDWPKFQPGITTTRDYIAGFSTDLIPCQHVYADRIAPYYTGPEVTAEQIIIEE